eukprot:132284_1
MAQKRKLILRFSPQNTEVLKRRKMNSVYINNNNKEEDSDSDFDPYELALNENESNVNINTWNNKNNDPPRYQTRSLSILDRNNNNNNIILENEDKNTMNKKRGRPKSKRKKKKSNHIDTSSKYKNNQNCKELQERLLKMDKYDTQQYISSITNGITNNEYIHPFFTKPTSLPKKRISKIMKLDPTTFKISSITVELMAILIEIFIRDLVSRSYKYTIKDNRKSLQLQDICRAVQSDHMYDFLIDIIPRIQSYDQENNMYNFIYTSQMNNCILTNRKGNQNEKNYTNQENIDDKIDNTIIIRRSQRIKSKQSDKEEAD